jgi:DNA-binding transcriptional regulator/RsmH inhibitor MraZ
MQAIELETTIDQNGTLHLPERYRFSFGAKARVIVLLKDSVEVSPSASWESQVMRFAGCLSDDFPDDITDADIGQDMTREALE